MAALFAHELDADGHVTRAPLLDALRGGALSCDALCLHEERPSDPALRARLAAGELTPTEDRAVGTVLGMAVGDALGAPVEFMAVRHGGAPPSLEGVGQLLPGAQARNVFALEAGQWTDDTAMGLCLADSLLAGGGAVRPADLMLRFLAWWHAGYNNAFAHDTDRRNRRVARSAHRVSCTDSMGTSSAGLPWAWAGRLAARWTHSCTTACRSRVWATETPAATAPSCATVQSQLAFGETSTLPRRRRACRAAPRTWATRRRSALRCWPR